MGFRFIWNPEVRSVFTGNFTEDGRKDEHIYKYSLINPLFLIEILNNNILETIIPALVCVNISRKNHVFFFY